MRLPVPSQKEVQEFRALYFRRFGVRLSPEEASEVATRFLQLYFLKYHAIHSIRPEE